jgi:hypothetical protein
MKVSDLIRELERATAREPELAEAEITFGEDMTPVLGGIFGHHSEGARVLNLAALKLDRLPSGF